MNQSESLYITASNKALALDFSIFSTIGLAIGGAIYYYLRYNFFEFDYYDIEGWLIFVSVAMGLIPPLWRLPKIISSFFLTYDFSPRGIRKSTPVAFFSNDFCEMTKVEDWTSRNYLFFWLIRIETRDRSTPIINIWHQSAEGAEKVTSFLELHAISNITELKIAESIRRRKKFDVNGEKD